MERRTYHNRLVNLLFNISSRVIRRVFLFLIQTHIDYRDLNDFLQRKKIELERTSMGKLNLKTLFPTRKRPTDLDKWDFQLLCFIVCDIFEPELIKTSVDRLRCIRNSLCHGSSTNISKVDYDKYVRNIREINDDLLSRIGDQNFKREIANETDYIINDKLDISGALEIIRDWYELDESHKERCTFDKAIEGITYDIFVSHSTEELTFVTEKLAAFLENDCNVKVCIPDRDFQPGKSIFSSFVDCIQNSRRVIIVLSREYVRDTRCMKLQFEDIILQLKYDGKLQGKQLLVIKYDKQCEVPQLLKGMSVLAWTEYLHDDVKLKLIQRWLQTGNLQ